MIGGDFSAALQVRAGLQVQTKGVGWGRRAWSGSGTLRSYTQLAHLKAFAAAAEANFVVVFPDSSLL